MMKSLFQPAHTPVPTHLDNWMNPILILSMLVGFCSASAFEPAHVEPARPADAFVDAIGVNVHLSYFDTAYSNYTGVIKPRLLEAGIRHIRDGCPGRNQTEFQRRLNDLGRSGVKAMLICPPHTGKGTKEILDALKAVPDALELVEGPNETDGAGINYQGLKFPEGTRTFQNDLFAAVKADPQLKAFPVVMSSISDPEKAPKLGQLESADFANTHCYAGGGPPGFRWNWYMDRCLTNIHRPIIASESGYHHATNHTDGHWIRGVTERAGGRYLPRLLAEYFTRGIVRTYLYEFLDLKDQPNYSEANFGILRWNGEPKPAYTTIKNLIHLLQDPSPGFIPRSLEFSINGDVKPVRHLLLQKRDGRFYLLLWLNAALYDTKAKQDIKVSPQPTRVLFAKPIRSAKAYLPLEGLNPTATFDSVSEILVQVPDHILVLQIVCL